MATDIIFLENLFEKTGIAKINVLLDNLYKIFIMEQMYPEVKCDYEPVCCPQVGLLDKLIVKVVSKVFCTRVPLKKFFLIEHPLMYGDRT